MNRIHFKTHKAHLSLAASPSNGVIKTCLHLRCHMLLSGRLPGNPKGIVCSLFPPYAAFLKSVLLVCGKLQHKRLCVPNIKWIANWSPMELPCRVNLHSSTQTAYFALCCQRMFVWMSSSNCAESELRALTCTRCSPGGWWSFQRVSISCFFPLLCKTPKLGNGGWGSFPSSAVSSSLRLQRTRFKIIISGSSRAD